MDEETLSELDELFDKMAEAEDELICARHDFEEAESALRRAVNDAGMMMSEYRESRKGRGLES